MYQSFLVQQVVYEQMVCEAMEQNRIHVETKSKRTKQGSVQHVVDLLRSGVFGKGKLKALPAECS
jgi:hypothetical protein